MYVCMYTYLCVTYTKQVCIYVAITIEEVGNLRVDGREHEELSRRDEKFQII